MEREQLLSEAARKPVVFSPPIISRQGVGIIGRGTLNIIQGPYGSHKSRLAETIASLMLSAKLDNTNEYIGFERTMLERFCLAYLDTERNQSEELPHAIQSMKLRAGYALDDKPADFRFTSIKAIDRKDRFQAIESFIRHVRNQTELHLIVVIDVVTDAIGDFNDPKESMKLYDFIGNLCDRHNATFLLVIHQNPGTEKARGHAGTEAANKAATVIQISLEKDAAGNDTELIKLRYLKLRRAKRPEPVYLQFSESAKGLVLANAEAMANHANQRKRKADVDDMAERLSTLLSPGPMPKGEVWAILETEFKAGNRTVRDTLKVIMEQPPDMYNEQGQPVRLSSTRAGQNQFYKLELVD